MSIIKKLSRHRYEVHKVTNSEAKSMTNFERENFLRNQSIAVCVGAGTRDPGPGTYTDRFQLRKEMYGTSPKNLLLR